MRKYVNKKLTALFLAAVMCGSLCADMTAFAEELTDQEVIISETEEQEDTVSEEEDQIAAEPELKTDESEEAPEEIPEIAPSEELENVQVENENNEEEKPFATQSSAISLQSIEGVCGENLTWNLDETTGTLTISGTGDMEDYYYDNESSGDEPWFEKRDQIVKVIIENGVTSIGRSAFGGLRKLKSIELSESITSIGRSAFYDCQSLVKVEIPASVISIGEEVFYDCNSLKNIVVSANNQKFASEDGILYNKVRNTLICYPGGRSKFSIPSYVSSIGPKAFYGCKNLSDITIPNSVANIGESAFYGCSSLETVKIPNGVKKIENSVFGKCGLREIMTPNSVTDIGKSAFYECSSLEAVKLPNSVTNIGKSAFYGCGFKTISIPDSVKNIDSYAFEGCALQSITIPSNVISIGVCSFHRNWDLKEVVLSEGLKNIGFGAFLSCDKLKSLTIPKSVSAMEEFAYGYSGEGGDKNPNAKIKCYTNTVGHKYAKDNGISYELLDGKKITKVSKVSISGISKKIAAGKKIKLTAKVSPSKATNKSVKWTSGNKKVATVNSKGVVTINKKAGGKSVTITAAATDGSKKKATYKISVMKGVVKKVAISGNKSVKAGKTLKLKAKVTATKKANKTLKWTSSNKKYATVNSSGKVKTYKAGKSKKVKITAEATDGSGKKKTVTIKIK